jgi:hypothetical protein
MPIEVAVWRIGDALRRIAMTPLDSEERLEETLEADLGVLDSSLMLIGRQVPTAHGKKVDLLAIDAEGNLSVIELKKQRTPREVVAQILDYASWVQGLSFEDIAQIHVERNGGKKLETAFQEFFGSSLPEEINQAHQLIIVASDLDPSTERIINYLSGTYGVPVNAVFFRHFEDGNRRYLVRSWLVDPHEAEAKASRAPGKKGSEPWNGRDFYISLGEGPHRTWADAQRYGFVSGGQGKWYSRTLKLLFPGARVFVHIPSTGYVGVGTVKQEAVPVKDFTVVLDGKTIPILKAPLEAPNMAEHADDPELSEYLVRVDWIKTVPREQAYWEPGLFALQHVACRMRSQFTIERLTEHFGLEE